MFIQHKLYLSYFIIISIFLLYGCSANKPQLKVEEKNPNANINAVISQLSQQISSSMLEQNKRKVAVINFPLLTGEMTDLGIYLSDKLINNLFQYRDKFEVVERKHLESILKEIELTLTGIMDDKTAQTIGKIIGADTIVIGTITDLGNEIDINIRMVGTEQGNVIAVATGLLAKNDTIIKLIENKIKNQQLAKDNKKQEKNEKDIKLNEFESLINSSPVIYTDKRNIAVIIESPKIQNELSPENVLYNLLGNGKNNIIINLFKEKLFKNKGFFKEIYEGDTELLKKTNALKKIDNLILGKLNYTFQKGTNIDKDLISCNINFAYKVINKNGDIIKIDNISVTSAGFTFDTALQRGIEILCETYSNRILKTS